MQNTREILRVRQAVRQTVRTVFDRGGFLEVDTPVLSLEVLPEPHIEPLRLRTAEGRDRFLQASPEALMKRLLAAESGPIYQFAHAFRDGERGTRHDIEFLLVEWYAPGTTLDDTAVLLEQLTTATLGSSGIDRLSCREAFARHAAVDLAEADADGLAEAAVRARIELPQGWESDPEPLRFDRLFELLLSEAVAPQLGYERPVMLEAWPSSQAAFARLDPCDPTVARRFELFASGVELVNGWEEETSAAELCRRISDANAVRAADGRSPLPVPENLIAAHGEAMPEGVGAALGFDRLVMLATGSSTIDDVRCFSSDTA
ncbi:MAG: EF-P lysine aminoacylase GenX [Planctomycetota bacterium]|nr:EF-P lysine aminoacylase GenX [Planctomycetota bacterium]MDA0968917.1 EF-P lysine aminoacylase GenX [Planctomycetota bacterium]